MCSASTRSRSGVGNGFLAESDGPMGQLAPASRSLMTDAPNAHDAPSARIGPAVRRRADRANHNGGIPREQAGTGQDRGRHERVWQRGLWLVAKESAPPTAFEDLGDKAGRGGRFPPQPRTMAEGQNPPPDGYLRIPRRLITSRYFFRLWSRRYFSKLDRLETIISSPRRLAWSLACVLK